MSEQGSETGGRLILEPAGRLILPEQVMAEIVMETRGCRLWYNEKTGAVGLRLLRGDESPPVMIERISGQDDSGRGMVDLRSFFEKIGRDPAKEGRSPTYRYFRDYHLLEIRLFDPIDHSTFKKTGFLDDYEGLDEEF